MIYLFKMLVFHSKLVDDRVYPNIFKPSPIIPAPEAYVDGEGNVKISPMIYGRQEDFLYLHGHVSAGVLRNGDLASSCFLMLLQGRVSSSLIKVELSITWPSRIMLYYAIYIIM